MRGRRESRIIQISGVRKHATLSWDGENLDENRFSKGNQEFSFGHVILIVPKDPFFFLMRGSRFELLLWAPNVMLPSPTVFWAFIASFLPCNWGAPSKWFSIQPREVVRHAFLQSGDKGDNIPTGNCKWYLLKGGQGGSLLCMLMTDKWGLWRFGGRSEFHDQNGEKESTGRATFAYTQVSDNNVTP